MNKESAAKQTNLPAAFTNGRACITVGDSFICPCGRVETPGAYVAAHWNERLTWTCPECGAMVSLCRGLLRIVKKGGKAKKPENPS